MPALDARDRVGKFVLRARRMMTHSLVREHGQLINDLSSGALKVNIQVNRKTGEADHSVHRELPPEEAFESFAARVRPFLMNKEPVYWAVVLAALESLLSKETLTAPGRP